MQNTLPTSMTMPDAEKKQLVRKVWLLPIILMVALLVGSWWAWSFTENGLIREKQKRKEAEKTLEDIRQKLTRASQEEQEIIQKSALFQSWEKRRVTQPLKKLDIQELLYTHAKSLLISEFEYTTTEPESNTTSLEGLLKQPIAKKAQRRKNREKGAELAPVKVSVLSQTMKFKIQHEKQIFDFLQAITTNPELATRKQLDTITTPIPPALTRLNQCNIARINPNEPLSPTKVNFSAQCQVQWLSILKG